MLVMPRLVAVCFMMPVLTTIGNLCGWFGGALVCKYTGFISVEPDAYLPRSNGHGNEGRV